MKECHIEEATNLALLQYEEECKAVNGLVKTDISDVFQRSIEYLVSKELGVVAIEADKVIGFMLPYGPIEHFFGNSSGFFTPIHSHGAIKEGRSKIYSKLYKEAAQYWASKDLFSHGIAFYAHDKEVLDTMFANGFGMRCMDAMTNLNENPLAFHNALEDITRRDENRELKLEFDDFQTLPEKKIAQMKEFAVIHEMKGKLVEHLRNSPVFFPVEKSSIDEFTEKSQKRESRFCYVKNNDELIGFIEVMDEGETIVSGAKDVKNICGAYLDPKYRGMGIFKALLGYVFDKYREQDINYLGVDCETTNPEAYHFWKKFFDPYTYSLCRRLDEQSKIVSHNVKTQP